MHQILFYVPLRSWFGIFQDIPIHGYGFMLFLAFVFCTLLAVYLARKQGIAAEYIHDLALWLFISGILGARIVYVVQYWNEGFLRNPLALLAIWDGGLVFYGSAIGGVIGYIAYYYLVVAKTRAKQAQPIRFWQLGDIVAPCVALGLCLGRIGCLLNGCCYGGPACVDCPSVSFPLPTEPRYVMVRAGYQTTAGFLMASPVTTVVGEVEPGSAADRAGLKPGDIILEVEGKPLDSPQQLDGIFAGWPRGENTLNLRVRRGNEVIDLSFVPGTIGLHPTQIYESISTGLLLFLLLSYFPFRRHDGEMFLILMLGYAVHRFLNESIRIDTDRYAFGLTLSQHISLIVLVTAVGLGVWLVRRPPRTETPAGPQPETVPAEPKASDAPETALQD